MGIPATVFIMFLQEKRHVSWNFLFWNMRCKYVEDDNKHTLAVHSCYLPS